MIIYFSKRKQFLKEVAFRIIIEKLKQKMTGVSKKKEKKKKMITEAGCGGSSLYLNLG